MKISMYFTLLWTIVVAPHLSTELMLFLSSAYFVGVAFWTFIEFRERAK